MRLVSLIMLLVFIACNIAGESSNEILKQVSNGEGEKAILFTKYGGSTVSNSTQVSILEENEQLSDRQTGNIFTCNQSDVVKMQWLSADTLEISYDKNIQTYIKEEKMNGISVVYKIVE
jgi:hypothetical protein